jgi:hypothetical protein
MSLDEQALVINPVATMFANALLSVVEGGSGNAGEDEEMEDASSSSRPFGCTLLGWVLIDEHAVPRSTSGIFPLEYHPILAYERNLG